MAETTELARAFATKGNFSFKEADALRQCAQLAEEYALAPVQLATHYDTFWSVR